jgi:hypothetical protein
MPNDPQRWAPELNEPPRPRADPYGLWKEGGSWIAGFVFVVLVGVVGMGVGFLIGYTARKIIG